MLSPELLFGLIGAGSIARRYAREIAANPKVRLKSIASRQLEEAVKFLNEEAQAFSPDAQAYTEYRQILDDPEVDAVLVCTWHDSHVPIGIDCLNAGKPVFMEKPLALSSQACLPLVQTYLSSKVHVMMGGLAFRYYNGNVLRLLRFIERPILIHGRFITPQWPDDFWAMKPVIGGGVIFSMGSHLMDLACLASRSEPVRIYASGGNITHPGSGQVDNLSVVLEFQSGASASLACGDCGELPPFGEMMLEVYDGQRSAWIPDFLPTQTRAVFSERASYFTEGRTYPLESFDLSGEPLTPIDDFVNKLLTDRSSAVFPELADGVRAIVLLEKAILSIRSGEPQTILRCKPEDGYYI